MSIAKKYWLGAAALSIALLVALAWFAGGAGDNPGILQALVMRLTHRAPVTLRWQVGSAQQYRFRTDSLMHMQLSNAAGSAGTQAVRVQMHGLLDLMTLKVTVQTALVGIQLAAVDLRVGGESDEQTNRALETPFRVRFSTAGMPEAFEFSAEVTAQHRSMLENLVRMYQVTIEKGDRWVAHEANSSGSFDAVYHRVAPAEMARTERNFTRPATPMFSGAQIASRDAIRIDPRHDWLAAMTLDETLSTSSRNGLVIDIANHAQLTLQPAAKIAFNTDAWAFIAAPSPPSQPPAQTALKLTPAEARRQILATLPELDDAKAGRTRLINRLRDLVRVDASLPAVILQALQTGNLKDRTRADLYLVLELAGSKAAQNALVSVMSDDGWSVRDALRAIVALGGIAEPSSDTLAALWQMADSAAAGGERHELASTATFALGNLGKAMNAAHSADYYDLRGRLLSGATSSNGTTYGAEQRADYLLALGNTRDASLTQDVVGMLDDSSPSVRRAAAQSLGMLGTDNAVASQLMARLPQESNRDVRAAIAESLTQWTTPSASAVALIAADVRAEADENTRYNMAHFLADNLAKFPQSRLVLQQLLRAEQSKRIRQMVADALAQTK